MGNPARPTKLKLLEGNPGHRPINSREIEPPKGAECPKFVVGLAKRLWNKYAPQLETLGILTTVDELAFATLCIETAEYLEMKTQMRKEGRKAGLHGMADKSLGKAKALFGEFGLTPSSRTRLSLPEQSDDDELDKIIEGTG